MNSTKIFLLISILFLYQSAFAKNDLPDLGEHSATLITPAEEKKLGHDFMQLVRASLPIIEDSIVNTYVQNLGERLVTHANSHGKTFHFFVVDDASINAFAGPDANIGINRGTILAATSESELAAVLAHEIAHVNQHHIARLIEREKSLQIPLIAGTLAAILIGTTTSENSGGSLATGAAIASMGSADQHIINFTRNSENEADHIGMKTLYNSGFDPMAMPNFFERMQRLSFAYKNDVPQFLLNHPVTGDRIAEAKDRAEQYPKKRFVVNPTYYFIQARLKALEFQDPKDAIKYFSTNTNKEMTLESAQYGLTLALLQDHQLTKAVTISENLLRKNPSSLLLQMLYAEAAVAAKKFACAISTLKTSLNKNPNYYPLIMQFGQTLLAANHLQEACYFLKMKTLVYSDDINLYRLLAQCFAKNNQIADAYQAKAKAYELSGFNKQAAMLLHQALKIPKLNATDRAIINARIKLLEGHAIDL